MFESFFLAIANADEKPNKIPAPVTDERNNAA